MERSLHLKISHVFLSSFYGLQPIIKSDCLGLSLVLQSYTCMTFGKNLCFSSVAQSCLTLCDPMDRSMPGLTVYHQLPELTQIHIQMVNRYMKKMLNTTIHERNANQNHNEVSPHTCENGYHQKSTNNKCWGGCGEKRTFIRYW